MKNHIFIQAGYKPAPLEIVVSRPTTLPTTRTSVSIAADCPQTDVSHFVAQLSTPSHYVYSTKFTSQLTYYDLKLTCAFNSMIQITYRCDLYTKKWLFIDGDSYSFDQCYPTCFTDERIQLLNKYFSSDEQRQIRSRYLDRRQSIRFRCFNFHDKRWKSIVYKCNSHEITKEQWFKIHSCFKKHTPLLSGKTNNKKNKKPEN